MSNDVTLKCTSGGITHMLEEHVKSRIAQGDQLAKECDSDIDEKEWKATIKVLKDINDKRSNSNEKLIFGGCDDVNTKDWQNCFVVKKNDTITFTKNEMDELYNAMGVKFENKEIEEVKSDDVTEDTNVISSGYTPSLVNETTKGEKTFLAITGIVLLGVSLLARKAIKSRFLYR